MADISAHFPRLIEAIDHLSDADKAAILAELADQGMGTTTGLTPVTLANMDYLTINGQEITGGTVPIGSGGTGATDDATARTNLGLGSAAESETTDFAAAVHTHTASMITDFDASVTGNSAVTANTAKTTFPGFAGSGSQNMASRSDHTHTASDITDFDMEVSGNTDVTANTAKVTFPGFAGTGSANTSSRSDHTHTASDITDFDAEVENNTAVTANTAKVGITTQQAADITANNAKVGITTAQATDIADNTADRHSAVTLSGEDYLSLSGQALVAGEVDLSDNVTGTLPLMRINQTELNARIDARAGNIGSVHTFANMAAFTANTDNWDIGDILIIQDTGTTYLFIGTPGTSTSLSDFQQITTPGGGINQATADGRYAALVHTHVASDVTDFATAVSSNSAVAANTAKVGITTQQAADITANNAKVTFPGFGTGMDDAARGNHTHTASQITDFATAVSSNTSVAANTAKVTFPGFGTGMDDAARGNHTHVAANITDFETAVNNNTNVAANTAKVTFPGFGTTATTAAVGNHTHTAANITDFDTEVSNNTNVMANTGARHAAVTLANTNYLSLNDQQLTGGTVPVGSGGTGATTNTAARTNLDVDQLGRMTVIDRTNMDAAAPLQFEIIANGGTPSGAGWITFELEA